MPSKLKHELDKVRGTVSATNKVYEDSIATIRDALTTAELSIKTLENESIDHTSKINNAISMSRSALKADATNAKNVNAAGAVMESDFGARSLMLANSTGVPVNTSVATNHLIGRAGAALGALSPSQIRSVINVADGADVTGSNPPQAHGASVHTDRTRKNLIVVPSYTTAGSSQYAPVGFDTSVDEEAHYHFKLPADFVSLTSVKVIWLAMNAVGLPKDWVLDITSKYGALTENSDNHTGSDTGNIININSGNISDYNAFTVNAGILSSVTKDDYIKIKLERRVADDDNYGSDIYIIGLEIEYTADM
jgi:hypothetical protein